MSRFLESLRFSAIRGVRTALQTFVAVSAGWPVVENVADVKLIGAPIAAGAAAALVAGVLAFSQNLSEELKAYEKPAAPAVDGAGHGF